MKRLWMNYPLMAPAGDGGDGGTGGGAASGTAPTGGEGGTGGGAASGTAPTGGEGGGSAFTQRAGEGGGSAFTQRAGEGDGGAGEGAGEGAGGAGEGSAFTQKGAAPEKKQPTAEELLAMTDEDWAKAVLPDDVDAEGHEVDRTFMTQMAQVARESGVTPAAMQRMSARFQELAKAQMAKEDEARAQEAARLDEANRAAAREAIAAFDDSQWENIRAAGAKYIPPDSELGRLMQGPLGSNQQLLGILNLLGESLRGDTPPTTGAAGSGRTVDEAVVAKTVPREFL